MAKKSGKKSNLRKILIIVGSVVVGAAVITISLFFLLKIDRARAKEAKVGESFTIRVGESVMIADAEPQFVIRLTSIDEACPDVKGMQVQCVRGGQDYSLTVDRRAITLMQQGQRTVELNKDFVLTFGEAGDAQNGFDVSREVNLVVLKNGE